MPTYRFKQLAVQLPAAGEGIGRDEIDWPVKCGHGSPIVALTNRTIQEARTNPAELATLRELLQRQVAQIKEFERAPMTAALPQTMEETTQLEQQLTGALEELRAHRTELQHRAGHASPAHAMKG